jgi:hypothetical protein
MANEQICFYSALYREMQENKVIYPLILTSSLYEGKCLASSPDLFTPGKRKSIKEHLELRHQARWTACTGCRQSKVLKRYPLFSRANELLAMSKLRLRAAVGLLTGHTTLRAHLYKLGHTEQQECRLCGYDKEDGVHIVCDCPVLACKRYRIWDCMFLKPEVLEDVRTSSLLSLMANTGLGLVS